MKSRIVEQVAGEVEIDWRKSQILISDNGLIVAYNGKCEDDNFEGTVLYSSYYDTLYFNCSWDKRSFKPIQEPITIEFSND